MRRYVVVCSVDGILVWFGFVKDMLFFMFVANCPFLTPFLLLILFATLQRAVDALLRLPQSESRDALIRLTHTVITRKK